MSLWRFRGAPHYLNDRGAKMGISPILLRRANHNNEILRVAVLLAQLAERYHHTRKEDGKPVFWPLELKGIGATLEQAECEVAKLHALAVAAVTMVDEAYEAFGIDQPPRPYAIRLEHDGDPAPAGPIPNGSKTKARNR
jgi:hypothetical protein